jgi:glycosyltransferase involved in cell wall biosynthesis
MNILFADLDPEWRGGQSQALLTLRGVRAAGHDITLLTPRNSALALRARSESLPAQEVPTVALRFSAANVIRTLLEGPPGSGPRFDLMHLNEPHALTAAWLARAHGRLPLLLSRRIGFPLQKNWISLARYRAVTRFLPNSKAVAESLEESGIDSRRISIVHEGVTIPPLVTLAERRAARSFWKIAPDEFLFGCVSVLVKEKGQRHIISAMPLLRDKYPQARLLLAGDGPCRAELESQARKLHQQEAVLFPGFVRNVEVIYAALDGFVFPSEFEGLGTALQSAMAYAIPCISTRRGALGEVVEDKRTALVVEPDGAEFASAMAQIMEDRAMRQGLGETARREVERRFSAERMIENTLAVYEEVLQKWRGRRAS